MFNLSLPCYSLSLLLLFLYTVGMENNLFLFITEHVFYLVKTISESPICLPFPMLNKLALLNVPHTDDFLGPWSVLTALLWPLSRRFISCWFPAQHNASVKAVPVLSAAMCNRREWKNFSQSCIQLSCINVWNLFSWRFLEAGCCWPVFTCSLL